MIELNYCCKLLNQCKAVSHYSMWYDDKHLQKDQRNRTILKKMFWYIYELHIWKWSIKKSLGKGRVI